MITDRRTVEYIRLLEEGNGGFLDALEEEAVRDHVPVIRKETQAFLGTMIELVRPERILEVGSAIGFSALLMCRHMGENAHITTIENYEKRIIRARDNIKRAGEEERITLIAGDGDRVLTELPGPYDFIFMDAAKGQYLRWLPELKRLLLPGGVLLTDNVLQDGETALSRYAVERRDRTIHTRMREYLWELTHSEDWSTSILPLGDGVALSVKKGN
ncbi:MAG: O-methyltransferase [Clostridium sp.]|nr:O-methyltransferase [Clostridium sp.]